MFSLTPLSRCAFSTSQSSSRKVIFVAAGSPTHDIAAARFMREVNVATNNAYRFIGIGGAEMTAAGLEKQYADISLFRNKPFFPLKNFLRFHIARCYHPYMASTHWANRKVLGQIAKSSLLDDLVSGGNNSPAAIITFGNEFFMKKLYVKVLEQYELHNTVRPPTFFYDRTHVNQRFEFKDYLDHFLYTIPKKQINFQDFTFPSTCVGHEGVGLAIKFLYENSKESQASKLISTGGVQVAVNHAHHRQIVERLVEEQRKIQRTKLGIEEDKQVIVLGPGNTKNEINFAVKLLSESLVNLFNKPELLEVDTINHFVIVITADTPENALLVETAVGKSKELSTLKVIITVGQTEKFSAICAGDIGVPTNGELVSEFAALQLPSVVIEKNNIFDAYVGQLYNNVYSDVNYAIGGPAYNELVASGATPFLLADEIFTIYSDPRLRYYFAQRYSEVIHAMIPTTDQVHASSKEVIELANSKTAELTNRAFTFSKIASKVLKAAEAYQNLDKKVPAHSIDNLRKNQLLPKAF